MTFDRNQRNSARTERAMALVSVMIVTVVLLAMAGAFFVAHRADLALLGSSTYREQTKNACLSVADFIQYKLQNDRTFGAQPFGKGRDGLSETFPVSGEPVMEVTYTGNGRTASANRISGRLFATEVDFEVTLVNNLVASAKRGDVEYDDKAPPRTVRAWVTSRRGNITSKIDVIFKQSPFTNASISSGEDVFVDLQGGVNGYWWLGARQPSGNAVRAKGKITGPEVWSKSGKAVQFLPPDGMESKLNPPYGVLQAKDLFMQVDGRHRLLSAGTSQLEQSETNVQGVLSPGGGAVKIPELSRKDLQAANRKVSFPYSNLAFRSVEGRGGTTIHRLEAGNGRLVAEFNPDEYDSRTHNVYDREGKKIAVFDLENRVMTVSPDTELEIDGDFQLRSVTEDGSPDTSRQPTIVLGDSERGASIDAPSIAVEGSVGGLGALKTSRGNLEIAAKSALSTTPDYGIALHAEGDVVLTKPGNNAGDGLPVDWDAFALGSKRGSNTTLNDWGNLSESAKQSEASSFKGRVLAPAGGSQFDPLWAQLTADFPADERAQAQRDKWLQPAVAAVTEEVEPDPDAQDVPPPTGFQFPRPNPVVTLSPSIPAGPGITVENYVRMREYLKTVKNGKPDPSWLEDSTTEVGLARQQDVIKMVKNQLSSYQLAAGQTTEEDGGQSILSWKPLSGFFGQSQNPYRASYAPDMLFRGLVYTKGDFLFNTDGKGVYIEGALVAQGNVRIENATGAHFVYNSDLLQNLFATDPSDLSIPLERAYWAYF